MKTGEAYVVHIDENLNEKVIRTAEVGEVFGLTEMLSGAPFEAGLRTACDCRFEFVPQAEYVDVLQKNPELCLHLLRQLSRHCRELLRSIG